VSENDTPPTRAPDPEAAPEAAADEGKAPAIERKFVGLVGVDSGTMVLGDPTYLLPSRERSKAGIDYQEVIDAGPEEFQPFARGTSLLLSLAMGDGTYPVFGEWEDGEFMSITVYLTPTEVTLADDLEGDEPE
jgi:hypothetical protein